MITATARCHTTNALSLRARRASMGTDMPRRHLQDSQVRARMARRLRPQLRLRTRCTGSLRDRRRGTAGIVRQARAARWDLR